MHRTRAILWGIHHSRPFMSDQPNVLFILSDQHCHKVLGHAGHPDVKTPNLDHLAQQGMRFTQAICQNPICTPSRMSWLSGQYLHNHGYYGLLGPRPQGLPSLMSHFKSGGYRTISMGKMHCPSDWLEKDCEVYHETCNLNERSEAYSAFLRQHDAEGKEDHASMPEFPHLPYQPLDGRPSLVNYRLSQEGWMAVESVKEMKRSMDEGRSFCMHLSLPKPHQVYAPDKEFWDLYPENSITLPPNADLDLKAANKAPHLIRQVESAREGHHALFEPKTFEALRLRKMRAYLGQISHVDKAVGEILQGLESLGIADDTIVVYSTDHGEYVYEFGVPEKAPGICSDSVCRIPFLMRYPDTIPKGVECFSLVESVDLINTLSTLCGLKELETSDGKNLNRSISM